MTAIIYDLLIDKDKLQEYSTEFLLDLAQNECVCKYGFTQDNLCSRMIEADVARVSCAKNGKIELVYIRFVPALRVQHTVFVPKKLGNGTLLHAAVAAFAFEFGKGEPLHANFSKQGGDTIIKVSDGLKVIESVVTSNRQTYILTYNQLVAW